MINQAASILAALGGVANIIDIEPCTTRLRSEVRDPGLLMWRRCVLPARTA